MTTVTCKISISHNLGCDCSTGCYQRKEVIHDYVKIGEFTLFLDDAKEYLYSKSTKHRILNWHDMHVHIYI